MQRVFLDANVLFSAAYRGNAGLLKLWKLPGVQLMTSEYAVHEAATNLEEAEQHKRLDVLLKPMTLVPHTLGAGTVPVDVILPQKDMPILLAAIGARATVLLTGDVAHFGRYYRKSIAGVRILPPGEFIHEMGG